MAKIAVVGCGAMGSVYAALMVDAGHEVHAVTLWPDHAEAMATKGLRCEGASGDRTVPIHASTTTDGIGPCDLVIIATKAFDVEAAARSCIPLLGPETIVQTIQNGLGSPEIAAPILGADRLAVGVVGGFGASIRAPGHAHHNGMEMIRFGAFAGLPKQLLQASAKIWESSGFKVAPFDDLQQMVWDKPPENSGRMKYPFYINVLFRIFGLTPEGLGGLGLHQKLRRASPASHWMGLSCVR